MRARVLASLALLLSQFTLLAQPLEYVDIPGPEVYEPLPVVVEQEPSLFPMERWWLNAALESGSSRPQQVPVQVFANGQPVFNKPTLDPMARLAFSVSGGVWLDAGHLHGLDASVFSLAPDRNEITYFATGSRTVELPAIDETTGTPTTFTLASPRVGIGAYQINAETKFQTADVNYRLSLIRSEHTSLDALVGYRYAHLAEGLHLYNKRMGADGFLIRTKDHISAKNQFHGGQVGLFGEYRQDCWYFSVTGKLGLGAVNTTTLAEGAFRVNGSVDPYGFYTRPAVSGERSHSNFAVMPVLNMTVGRQISNHARVYMGWTVQYLSCVYRPSDVFDPLPALNGLGTTMTRDAGTSDFWATSINFGMEWRY